MVKYKKSQPTGLKAARSRSLGDPALFQDARKLIAAAREQTARVINTGLVMMYWHIGRRIREDILKNERAE